MSFVEHIDGRIAREEAMMEEVLRNAEQEDQVKARLKCRRGVKPRIIDVKQEFEAAGEDWRPQHRNLENEARRREEYRRQYGQDGPDLDQTWDAGWQDESGKPL